MVSLLKVGRDVNSATERNTDTDVEDKGGSKYTSRYTENSLTGYPWHENVWAFIRTLEMRVQIYTDEGEIGDSEFKAKNYSCI